MGNTFSDSSSDSENDSENEEYQKKTLSNEVSNDVVDNISNDAITPNIIDNDTEIIIEWKSDTLDHKVQEIKFTHTLETLLHNYFLLCNKEKIVNINIKKYSTQKKSPYCKLLLNIHKNIKESEEMIEDVLESFPFEYKSINMSEHLSEDTDSINVSVIDNILRIFEFYNKCKYSKVYCLYNLFLETKDKENLSIKEAFESINKNGVCLYDECATNFEEPSADAYRRAQFRNELKYYRVKQNINDLKQCLNEKKIVLFGISIYESFYKYEHIESPKNTDKKLNDTCMMLVGYNDEEREWLIKNERLYKISFDYLLNKNLCKDFWYFEI
jgi:hypothetical protein